MTETIHGGCLCGKIRYSIELTTSIDKIKANYCHCTMCRKASGAPIASFVVASRDKVSYSGDLEIKKYQSSEGCLRGFCPNCGSQLTWERVGSEKIDFGLGTFDNPHGFKPQYHLFCENKIIPILDDVPKYEQFSDSPLIKDN